MKIEELILKLQEIAKENPGIEVASYYGIEAEPELDFVPTIEEYSYDVTISGRKLTKYLQL